MPRLLTPPEKEGIITELVTRFGFPETLFAEYAFLEQGKKSIWLLRDTPFIKELLTLRRLETTGLRILRWGHGCWKPTTYGLQLFGQYATRNVIVLEETQVQALFLEGKIESLFPLEKGYVIMQSGAGVLGCGLYTGSILLSQIPRHRSTMVTSL